MDEMVLSGCHRLMREHLITNKVGIYVGYSKDVIPPTNGSVRLHQTTNLYSIIKPYVRELFCRTTNKENPIRRIGIDFTNLVDDCCEGYDLFTDMEAVEREKRSEAAVLYLQDRYGKNAVLRATDLLDGATAIQRNKLIGGHNSE